MNGPDFKGGTKMQKSNPIKRGKVENPSKGSQQSEILWNKMKAQ